MQKLIFIIVSVAVQWVSASEKIVVPNGVGCAQFIQAALLDKAAESKTDLIQPFNDYFNEAEQYLEEREYLLSIARIALLAREHILLMGPPGNAKTMFADIVYGNIRESSGKPSYYRVKMNPETGLNDTHGPVDMKKLSSSGRIKRLYEEGILGHRLSFIDEFFDSRPKTWRNTLDILAERKHGHYEGKTWSVLGATNKYLAEIYEKAEKAGSADEPRALVDRFAFIGFVPSDFESFYSYLNVMQNQRKQVKMPQLTFDQIAELHELTDSVVLPGYVRAFTALLHYTIKPVVEGLEWGQVGEYKKRKRDGEDPMPPGRAPKYPSPRTLGKAANILQAIVMEDWLRTGGKRSLIANLDDVAKLEKLYAYNGPGDDFMPTLVSRSVSPYESHEINMINSTRNLFRTQYTGLFNSVNEAFQALEPSMLVEQINSLGTTKGVVRNQALEKLFERYKAMYEQVHPVDRELKMSEVNPQTIAALAVLESFDEWLQLAIGQEKAASTLEEWAHKLSGK